MPSSDIENCHQPCHKIQDSPVVHVDLGSPAGNIAETSTVIIIITDKNEICLDNSIPKAGVGKFVLLSLLAACFVGCLLIIWCKYRRKNNGKNLKEEEPMVSEK